MTNADGQRMKIFSIGLYIRPLVHHCILNMFKYPTFLSYFPSYMSYLSYSSSKGILAYFPCSVVHFCQVLPQSDHIRVFSLLYGTFDITIFYPFQNHCGRWKPDPSGICSKNYSPSPRGVMGIQRSGIKC